VSRRAVALALLLAAVSASAQDVAAGRAAFGQCAVCHATGSDNGAGPGLGGVLGRQAGALAGFRYSRAMKNFGKAWDAQTLQAYLADPQAVVPGNTMPFSGVADEKQRVDLVAYLATLK
jgi:cytochrome c